jgi:ribose transport system permease protein
MIGELGGISERFRRLAAVVVLVVTVIGGAVAFGDSFANRRNFSSMAVAASFLAIIAIGMTFVIISGGIDLSVGSLLALAAVLTAYASRWGSVPAALVPLAVCSGIGMIQGLLIGKARLAPFIVTLAGLLFARGLAFKVSDNGNVTHLIPSGTGIIELGQGTFLGVGYPAWLVVPIFLAGLLLLNRTRFGQTVFAIGGSEEAAQLMGLRVARTQVLLYTMMGFLSGVAGMLVAARSSSGLSTIGIGLELDAIAAVVIGGTLLTGGSGGLTGTVAGVLLLGVIQNLINQVGTLSSYYQQVVSGVFLIIVIAVQRLLESRAEE